MNFCHETKNLKSLSRKNIPIFLFPLLGKILLRHTTSKNFFLALAYNIFNNIQAKSNYNFLMNNLFQLSHHERIGRQNSLFEIQDQRLTNTNDITYGHT